MNRISRRRFLQLSAMIGGALLCGDLVDRVLGAAPGLAMASAAEPIKIGILDPLSIPTRPLPFMMCMGPMWPSICSINVAVC